MENSTVYWSSVIIILVIGFCVPFIVDQQFVKRGYVLTSVPASIFSILFCPLLVFIMTAGYSWETAKYPHKATLEICLGHALFYGVAAILVRSYPAVKHRLKPDARRVKQAKYYVILAVEMGEPFFLAFLSCVVSGVLFPNLQPISDWLFLSYPIGYILLLAALGVGCAYLFQFEKRSNLNKVVDESELTSEDEDDDGPGCDVQNPKYG